MKSDVIRAVLFDVGGPLDTEVLSERLIDRDLRAALAAEGVVVTDEAFEAAARKAVSSFAPDAYKAIVWEFAGGDAALARRAYVRFHLPPSAGEARARERGGFELRPGIAEVIQRLHARGLLLGLAANQPRAAVEQLERVGIGQYFRHRQVAGYHGFRKPDVRLFLLACEDLGVRPEECVMVGDRIDNDIAPARLLGMCTVLFRTGRHIEQQARSVDEVPDVEVRDVAGLEEALMRLTGGD